jgi:hypothetical protein
MICTRLDEELKAEDIDGTHKTKRRLVSLFEANEIAKRLAARTKPTTPPPANGHGIYPEPKRDVVSEWLRAYCICENGKSLVGKFWPAARGGRQFDINGSQLMSGITWCIFFSLLR